MLPILVRTFPATEGCRSRRFRKYHANTMFLCVSLFVLKYGDIDHRLSRCGFQAPSCRSVSPQLPKRCHQKICSMLHQQAGKGPVGGVGCRFKVSIDDMKAQQPSVLFPLKTIKNQPAEKPQVNAKCSKAGVKLHLRLHSLNCAGTLSWQRLTFSWKTLRKNRVRGQTVGSD